MRYLSFFLALSALLLGACGAQPDKVMDGTPEITFVFTDTTLLEIDDGDTRDFEYVFENTGTASLMILDVDVSCGCTLTSWNRTPIEPGEKGTLKIHFNSTGMQEGLKHNKIDVFTNGNWARLFFTAEII